jgi:hypothetical protein
MTAVVAEPGLRMTSTAAEDRGLHMSEKTTTGRLSVASAVLGALALVLAVATVAQSEANSDLQVIATQGQAQLAKAQALTTLDNNLVQLLAKAAAENNDNEIRTLLARNGVTFHTGSATAVAPVAGGSR